MSTPTGSGVPMKVLIAGGGIAGLAAAIALLKPMKEDIEVVILEKDLSSDARIQGYTLGIGELGAKALQSLGLMAQQDSKADDHVDWKLLQEAILLGSNFFLGQEDGTVMLQVKSELPQSRLDAFLRGKMALNRGVLRRVMLEEIAKYKENATIEWGAKIVHLQVRRANEDRNTQQPTVQVTLENGTTVTGDVLLGCDGIFSKVRELVPNCLGNSQTVAGNHASPPLRHLGIAWVRGVCREQGQFRQWFPNSGSFLAGMTDTRGNLFTAECDRMGGNIMWYFAFPESDAVEKRIDDLQQIQDKCEQHIHDNWHPIVLQLIQDTIQQQQPLLFRHLYDRTPEDLKAWKVPEPWVPITLLGDALHPVASYALAGGGNNALSDGVDVAKTLLQGREAGTALADALRNYERPVLERSIPQAKRSLTLTRLFHSGWLGGYVARAAFFMLSTVLWWLGVPSQ